MRPLPWPPNAQPWPTLSLGGATPVSIEPPTLWGSWWQLGSWTPQPQQLGWQPQPLRPAWGTPRSAQPSRRGCEPEPRSPDTRSPEPLSPEPDTRSPEPDTHSRRLSRSTHSRRLSPSRQPPGWPQPSPLCEQPKRHSGAQLGRRPWPTLGSGACPMTRCGPGGAGRARLQGGRRFAGVCLQRRAG